MSELVPNRIPDRAFEEAPFNKWELVIKTDFSLEALYKRLYFFLVEEDWIDLNGEKSIDGGGTNYEEYYLQRNHGPLRFHIIWWRATRRPKIHGNKYYNFYLAFDIYTLALKEKEVMHKGKKIKLDSGEFKILAHFYLVDEDPSKGSTGKEWNEHGVLSFMKNRFWNRENKHVLDLCRNELIQASNDIYELIQTYMGVLPEGKMKDFTPVQGKEF